LFFTHPGTIFHVRDIVRKVSEEINAVRRELAHMEKAGMVTKEQRANRLFYAFRKDYPLYFDLLELIGKTSGLGWDLIKQRAKLGKIKFAMISGRYLRGLAKKSATDVDLLVVGNVVLPELAQLVKAEEVRREREINYTVYSPDEFARKKSTPFLSRVLKGEKIMLVGELEKS